MNTLVTFLVILAKRWLLVAWLGVGALSVMVTTTIDQYVPYRLDIPLLPAAGIGSLLITLGIVVGRAGRSVTHWRPDPRPELPAAAMRPVARSSVRALTDSTPTYAVLPAVRQNGDTA